MQVILQQTKQQQEHKQNTARKKLLRLGDYKCSNYSTVQKKCKRNSVFFVLCSRENSTKLRHEISSKRSRIFVESNEISLSSCWNFASTSLMSVSNVGSFEWSCQASSINSFSWDGVICPIFSIRDWLISSVAGGFAAALVLLSSK